MKKRFTLTEILVVVFLIGVLSAIGFGMYSYAMNSAKESSTRSLLTRLGAGLETCNTKLGYIPLGKDKNVFNEIRFELNTDGTVKSLTFTEDSNKKVSDEYLKEFIKTIDGENLKKSLQKESDYYVLIDSWGNKVYYAYPGKFNRISFDFYSPGADGRIGKGKDEFTAIKLNSATLGDFKDDSTNELLSDDIFNF
ncbi:MAG: type II secretion system protein GspG [Victivallales bacterium]|jgi:prepilin-type N-terminal cleavage/methylation domain-containing protein|nr:type II secretion system protein GspG [Victivallales bacterium]